MARAPAEQVQIALRDQRAAFTATGATLRAYDFDEIRLWQDCTFDFVHVYTGDTLPETERRRRSVAVEPMTYAPNAFNSGDGLRVLRSRAGA